MEVINNKEGVPFEDYKARFTQADPAEIEARTGLRLEEGRFSVTLMRDTYRIGWPDLTIECVNADAYAMRKLAAQTYMIRHLLEGRAPGLSGGFLTFREMPWGELYIKPFTDRIIKRAAFTFGPRIDALREAIPRFGTEIGGASVGAEFEIMPGFRMRLLIWEGDDEFPPNSQMLFGDNFKDAMSAEDRVVSAEIALSIIKSYLAQ